MKDVFQTEQDVRDWCREARYEVDEYILQSHGTERCDVCGEPLAAGLGGIGEFYEPRDPSKCSVVAHAQCGLDQGLEIA